MAKISFTKLGLKLDKKTQTVKINDSIELEVRSYLPVAEKIEFINFVVSNAIDEKTGCFSPIRTEVYFCIGIAKWYAGITFTDKQLQDIGKTYDLLEDNNVINSIMSAIPEDEIGFMSELINDTTSDIARYNSSFAGVVSAASGDAGALDEQISKIMENVRNKEGLEVLSAVKDVVGTD